MREVGTAKKGGRILDLGGVRHDPFGCTLIDFHERIDDGIKSIVSLGERFHYLDHTQDVYGTGWISERAVEIHSVFG